MRDAILSTVSFLHCSFLAVRVYGIGNDKFLDHRVIHLVDRIV